MILYATDGHEPTMNNMKALNEALDADAELLEGVPDDIGSDGLSESELIDIEDKAKAIEKIEKEKQAEAKAQDKTDKADPDYQADETDGTDDEADGADKMEADKMEADEADEFIYYGYSITKLENTIVSLNRQLCIARELKEREPPIEQFIEEHGGLEADKFCVSPFAEMLSCFTDCDVEKKRTTLKAMMLLCEHELLLMDEKLNEGAITKQIEVLEKVSHDPRATSHEPRTTN